MGRYTDSGKISCVAATALAPYRRVTISVNASGQKVATYSGVGAACHGITTDAANADDHVTVRLNNCPGTFMMVVDGAVAAMGSVYGAANGFGSATVSGTAQFIALEAATAANAEIEVLKILA